MLASVMFGINPTLTKELIQTGMSPSCIVFFSHSAICLFNLSAAAIKHSMVKISLRQMGVMLMTGAAGMGMTSLLLGTAYMMIPVGLTTILHFLYPLFVVCIMTTIFKEKFIWRKAVGMAGALCGLTMIVQVDSTQSVKGILIAIASGLVYAIYIIISDKGCFVLLPIHTKMVFMALGSMLFLGVQSALTGTLALPPSLKAWAFLAFQCCVSIIGYTGLTYGISRTGASVAAFATTLEPVTSVVAGIVVYREVITPSMAAGIALILASVLTIATESKLRRQPETQSPVSSGSLENTIFELEGENSDNV